MLIGLTAALAAAAVFGVAAVVQAIAARTHGMLSGLMLLVGLSYVAGWFLHLVAIARLPLYLAQTGVAVSLVVTALVAAFVVGEPLAARHWAAVAAMMIGLVILTGASGAVGDYDFATWHTVLLYVALLATLGIGLLARRLHSDLGGVLLGAVAGLAYCGSPVASRALVDPTWDADVVVPALTIGLFGLLGFWLYSLALTRASVTAATAPLVLIQTVGPAAAGLALFGDGVRAGWWPVAVIGFGLSVVGALVLCGAEARLEQVEHPRLATTGGVGAG